MEQQLIQESDQEIECSTLADTTFENTEAMQIDMSRRASNIEGIIHNDML